MIFYKLYYCEHVLRHDHVRRTKSDISMLKEYHGLETENVAEFEGRKQLAS
jgi:hypothetical protein